MEKNVQTLFYIHDFVYTYPRTTAVVHDLSQCIYGSINLWSMYSKVDFG